MNRPDHEKMSGLADAPLHLGPPPRVPDYELVRRVGGGSYGDVWLARGVTGAWRAIKVVQRARFDRDKPYEREFNGILRFEPVSRAHESQVDILHVGRNDELGCFYYVMELADDQRTGAVIQPDTYAPRTLRSELQARGRLPLDEVIRLGVSLATALEHLHTAGLVHRDVKPSNIIYIGGVPKLADIGLVTDSASTRSYVGTEGYLSPEGPGAPAADVFGLGKVLYEAASGRDRLEFPEMPEGFADWPERDRLLELNEVLLRAGAPETKDRYASATELRTDLERLQRGESVKRRNDTRRALRFAAQLAAAMVVLAALVTAAVWAWRHRPVNTAGAPVVVPGAVVENRLTFRATLLQNAARLRQDPADQESARRLLGALSTNSFFPPAAPTLVHRADVNAVAFSPDGATLLAGTETGGAVFWNWRAGTMTGGLALASGAPIRLVCFSADGRFAAAGAGDGTVHVWNAAAPETPLEVLRANSGVSELEFSPDGRWLAFATTRAQTWLWNTGRTGPARLLPGVGQITALRFASDSRRLLLVGSEGGVQLLGLPDGQPLIPAVETGAGIYDADWSADGERVVLGLVNGGVRVLDGGTLQTLGETAAHTRRVLRVRVSPDGELAVTVAADRTARLSAARTAEPWGTPWEPARQASPAVFTPDGLWLAALTPDLIQWFSTFDARPVGEPIVQLGSVRDLAFSPDGRTLASAGTLGQVRLWEARPGRAWAGPSPRGNTALVPWQPPAQLPPAPDWLAELAELIGGGRGEGAEYEPLMITPLFALRDRLQASRETDFWTRWGQWFFADRATRTIHPDSALTVPQLAEHVARANTLAAHELAVQLAPDDARAWSRLAAFLRANPEAPDAPRRFTAEWCAQRARALAPDDPEVKRLLGR